MPSSDYLRFTKVSKALILLSAPGEARISTTLLAGKRTVLRACITKYLKGPVDIQGLIESLAHPRCGYA
jgi:hypothetical protein